MAAAAGSMDFDELAWAASNDTFDTWKTNMLLDTARLRKFRTLIADVYGGCPDELLSPRMGGSTFGCACCSPVAVPQSVEFPGPEDRFFPKKR